jgi:hypothetical protein
LFGFLSVGLLHHRFRFWLAGFFFSLAWIRFASSAQCSHLEIYSFCALPLHLLELRVCRQQIQADGLLIERRIVLGLHPVQPDKSTPVPGLSIFSSRTTTWGVSAGEGFQCRWTGLRLVSSSGCQLAPRQEIQADGLLEISSRFCVHPSLGCCVQSFTDGLCPASAVYYHSSFVCRQPEWMQGHRFLVLTFVWIVTGTHPSLTLELPD